MSKHFRLYMLFGDEATRKFTSNIYVFCLVAILIPELNWTSFRNHFKIPWRCSIDGLSLSLSCNAVKSWLTDYSESVWRMLHILWPFNFINWFNQGIGPVLLLEPPFFLFSNRRWTVLFSVIWLLPLRAG